MGRPAQYDYSGKIGYVRASQGGNKVEREREQRMRSAGRRWVSVAWTLELLQWEGG